MTINVTVTNTAGTSATSTADQFTYEAVPTVTGLSTNTGPLAGGTQVILTGMNFVGVTGVKFGTVAASFTYNTPTQITCLSPVQSAAGAVNVYVTTTVGTSVAATANVFTYTGSTTTGNVPVMPTLPSGYTSTVFSEQWGTQVAVPNFNNVYGGSFGSYVGTNPDIGASNQYSTPNCCFVAESTGGGGNSLYNNMYCTNGTAYCSALTLGNDAGFLYGGWGSCCKLVMSGAPAGYTATNSTGVTGFGIHYLMWPSTYAWTNEVDFPDNPGVGSFAIAPEGSSYSTNSGCAGTFSGVDCPFLMTDGLYHTFQTIWTSTSLTHYADGVELVNFTGDYVPQQSMYAVLQTEAQGGGYGATTPSGAIALLETAWCYVWQK